jgi:peptidoglycan/LPS O-acetylase OafA/YrhL
MVAADSPDPSAVREDARHVAGLDSIRFVCALWVVFGHFGFFPLTTGIDMTHPVSRRIGAVVNNFVSGPAAVIVFFLISGFCINYAYRDGRAIPLKSFYARRYVRILAPMGAAIALGFPLGINLGLLNDSILWSLLAEEIYYFLYPLLHALRRRFAWPRIIAVAYVFSLLVVLRDPRALNYASYGPFLNWLLGLPCWLLGCYLAELPTPKTPSISRIWLWRGGVWAASVVASGLRFHSPLRYPWTLNLFALLVFFWLRREIAYRREHAPLGWLEQAGLFSYSIYLTHLHAHALFVLIGIPFLGSTLHWAVQTGFILAFCYTFYRLVEKPSHALARKLGRRLLSNPAPTLLPSGR